MNIVNKRKLFFVIAAIIVIVCAVALGIEGLKSGVEFSSGSILNIDFESPVNQDALRQEVEVLGYKNATIQSAGTAGTEYIIRINATNLDEATRKDFTDSLTSALGPFQTRTFDNVSPIIAAETTRNAIIAVVVAVIAMLLYIAFAFRKMPNPFKYGVCAIVGLVIDLVVALGVFAILGAFRGWQIDLMFVAGILAVLGYSVNNTVIVFDRMRENTERGISSDIEVVANKSIVETLGRSFNTSLTTLFTLLVLALFVGATIQNFVVVLIIGTISGSLSSTFVSPELLVTWEKKQLSGSSSNEKEKAVEPVGLKS